jgi:hypothetical protein
MQSAEAIAQAYWASTPCGGSVTIQWADLDPTTNAQSTWSNPTSSYGDAAENFDCTVQFNRRVDFDWPMFCTVLVHEFGHLTGHPHSSDPNDVMSPYYTQPLAQCASTPDPTLTFAPPPVAAAAPAPAAARAATPHRPARPRAERRRHRAHATAHRHSRR